MESQFGKILYVIPHFSVLNQNIGNKDYLQMLAYMFRFDSNCGLYFFPFSKDENADPSSPKEELRNSKSYFLNQGNSFNSNVEKRNKPEICLKK